MSALWGNATWALFHTFAEQIDETFYQRHYPSCLDMFKKICQHLPCPDCCAHATAYLKNIKPVDVNTKAKLRRMFYIFHNRVNQRLHTPLFPEGNLIIYSQNTMNTVLHNFVKTYTKNYDVGLLAGRIPTRSMRRSVAHSVLQWFRKYWRMFHP